MKKLLMWETIAGLTALLLFFAGLAMTETPGYGNILIVAGAIVLAAALIAIWLMKRDVVGFTFFNALLALLLAGSVRGVIVRPDEIGILALMLIEFFWLGLILDFAGTYVAEPEKRVSKFATFAALFIEALAVFIPVVAAMHYGL